jgi:hypothetical protein
MLVTKLGSSGVYENIRFARAAGNPLGMLIDCEVVVT